MVSPRAGARRSEPSVASRTRAIAKPAQRTIGVVHHGKAGATQRTAAHATVPDAAA